jgi:hypothetical protein
VSARPPADADADADIDIDIDMATMAIDMRAFLDP